MMNCQTSTSKMYVPSVIAIEELKKYWRSIEEVLKKYWRSIEVVKSEEYWSGEEFWSSEECWSREECWSSENVFKMYLYVVVLSIVKMLFSVDVYILNLY